MLSLQLVPHYAEGVIYPLDADEVAERIGVDVKKGDLGDELVAMMKGLDVSTIDFLRIQFKDEWDNFVERMIARHGVGNIMQDTGIAKEDITERHFLKSTGSIFSANPNARMDLMIWASERGQMLSRCAHTPAPVLCTIAVQRRAMWCESVLFCQSVFRNCFACFERVAFCTSGCICTL